MRLSRIHKISRSESGTVSGAAFSARRIDSAALEPSSLFRALFFYFATYLFAAMPALAMTDADDIDTNRPSFMASPLVVPRGSLQLENGAIYQHFQHGMNYFNISETEVRLGVTKSTEFQVFVPQWVMQQTSGGVSASASSVIPALETMQTSGTITQAGATSLSEIGLKHQFPPVFKDLNVALIAGVNVPTGNRFFSGTGVQPVVRIPFTKGLTEKWSVGGMQSILVVNSGRDAQWQNSFLISRALGARSSIFAEYGGFYTQQEKSMNIAHFGAVRKLNKNTQVDLQFGFALDRTAPSAFIGAGYSFRFDRLPLIEKL